MGFEIEVLDKVNFQGSAVVNYTEREIPYTRIIEHKHFNYGAQNKTVISMEYPMECGYDSEPFYPINDIKNNAIYDRYKNLVQAERNVIFGGRLGCYKYYDMDRTIAAALEACQSEFLN